VTKFDANVRSYAPVRARLVREPYRRIRKTSGYAGGYLFHFEILRNNYAHLTVYFPHTQAQNYSDFMNIYS
ncbi:hypothetical protein, partial [Salmonella enterica]|uniref:hypothetical protein n=1 Tax=Salmonella enterica TaxID=28901 RepID=UPI0019D6DB5E